MRGDINDFIGGLADVSAQSLGPLKLRSGGVEVIDVPYKLINRSRGVGGGVRGRRACDNGRVIGSPAGGAGPGPIVQRGAGRLDEAPPEGYFEFLASIKARVLATQVRAARAASTEVLRLYWSIGRDILARQGREGWGAKVVTRLARDLRAAFPGQSGWSRSNLLYMRRAAEVWPVEDEFVQHVAGRLPWGHVMVLLDRLATREDRDWYAERAAVEGWKRSVLEHFIKADLKHRAGAAPTNFPNRLTPPDSELAQQLVRDPYVFEHLAYVERIDERSVEQALMDRLQDTLTEFGRGMAFVGRQLRFEVTDRNGDTEELVPDLLLFSIPQSRYVVVESLCSSEHNDSDVKCLVM
ncbi:MAG: PDDEXK nuclease domain-containing protein [Bifidobacteriaceae bacterium]|nr:PDDEXK nuclease domain-containing protein [Bifidobacteriaceae bacterium]